jgi:hypothetical protein
MEITCSSETSADFQSPLSEPQLLLSILTLVSDVGSTTCFVWSNERMVVNDEMQRM